MRTYQDRYNEQIETLWDLIDALKALETVFRPYFNDPVDLDDVGCFV